MSKQSNQIAEIVLRYYIVIYENIQTWSQILTLMSAVLNPTEQAPNQVFYGFKTRFLNSDSTTPKPKILFPQKLMQFPDSQFSHQSRCTITDLII